MKKIGFVVLLVSLILSTPAFAQQRTISGVILSSENQEPLIGATVSVKGNEAHGVVTDIDGKYTLEVGPDDRILVIAYLGMKTQFIKVPHKSQLNIVLEPESLNLDEVVVTGYGNFTKSSFTGSANTLKGDMMKNIPVVSVEQKLQDSPPVSTLPAVPDSPEPTRISVSAVWDLSMPHRSHCLSSTAYRSVREAWVREATRTLPT